MFWCRTAAPTCPPGRAAQEHLLDLFSISCFHSNVLHISAPGGLEWYFGQSTHVMRPCRYLIDNTFFFFLNNSFFWSQLINTQTSSPSKVSWSPRSHQSCLGGSSQACVPHSAGVPHWPDGRLTPAAPAGVWPIHWGDAVMSPSALNDAASCSPAASTAGGQIPAPLSAQFAVGWCPRCGSSRLIWAPSDDTATRLAADTPEKLHLLK